MCYVEIIGNVAADGILCWNFVSLETSLVGCLLRPNVAVFMFSGLTACVIESQRHCDFLNEFCFAFYEQVCIRVNVEGRVRVVIS